MQFGNEPTPGKIKTSDFLISLIEPETLTEKFFKVTINFLHSQHHNLK